MAYSTPKDYFGNELCVGDTVVFSPDNSTDLIEGAIEEIEYKENGAYLTIVSEKSYGNIFVWERNFNRVIKKFNTKQKQENTKNNLLFIRIYTAYDNKFIEYKDANCKIKKFGDKLFLCVYSNSDNSILALWNMDSIYGFSFEED